MVKKHILIVPGDGIGQEVTAVGKKVLEKIAAKFGHEFTYDEALIGHEAIEATGDPLPAETLVKMKASDAVLFGAVGHPKYDNDPSAKVRPEQGLLRMRKELGLYANLRPIKLFDELLSASSIKPEILKGADILFFRELTGDIYFGEKGRKNNGDTAYDVAEYSRYEVERIGRKAFEAARTRKKHLVSVDKANVLESSRLWREEIQKLALEYPDVTVEYQFVDATAMLLIKDPKRFDVVVTANLFGDILSDLGGALMGFMYGFYFQLPQKKNVFVKEEKVFSFVKVAQKRIYESVNEQDNQEVVEEELNQILDKISKSGYDSLSKYEKRRLFKASQKNE